MARKELRTVNIPREGDADLEAAKQRTGESYGKTVIIALRYYNDNEGSTTP